MWKTADEYKTLISKIFYENLNLFNVHFFLLKYHIIKWNNNEILNDKLLPHLFYAFPK